ncbi:major capsid protein [Lactococcus phage P1046]|uniref:Major capsid protein n=1 Tax=Lactococcus phage P1046 TaxID=2662294 RepID=A0A649V1K6_9CAUD|nr:major capsid protein [Lactococcus phage P1046]
MKKDYDFSGWVTKNDIVCTDGVTIKQGAFSGNEGQKVPLVWNHNYGSNDNILGHIILHNTDQGVYGYGHFNDTSAGQNAKVQLQHGDLNSMSIGAKNIKRVQPGNQVIHGNIYEVSLVMAPANSGALIDHVMTHGDEEGERAIVYTGNRVLLSEDLPDEDIITHAEGEDNVSKNDTKTTTPAEDKSKDLDVEAVFATLSPEQEEAVAAVIGAVMEEFGLDPEQEGAEDPETEDETAESEVAQSENLKGDDTLKHNAFNTTETVIAASGAGASVPNILKTADDVITHADFNTIISAAAKGYAPSLATVVADTLKHAEVFEEDDTVLKHAITNIDVLFPNTKAAEPFKVYNPQGQNIDKIMAGFFKTPMSRIKNVIMDLTEDEARARGYIKGNQKLDSIESVYFRETTPGTVMRREKFDRDDIIDIAENGVDAVKFVQATQKIKLAEEIVRAAFLGDGRPLTLSDGTKNPDKISELHIRPIAKDDDLYTIKVTVDKWVNVVDKVMIAMAAYDGSGQPTLYINPFDLQGIKTLKDTQGRYLFGPNQNSNAVPTDANIAAYFGCNDVIAYRRMPRGNFIIGNLSDYAFGSSKGGEITNFDFFDIDFNQMKYLTETRLSGAIQAAKSFIFGTVTSPEQFGDLTVTAVETAKLEQFDKTGVKSSSTWLTDSDPTPNKTTTTTTTTRHD